MTVTFIHHSSFLIETKEHVLLFDYFDGSKIASMNFNGKLPDIPEHKRLYVFASHAHHDHFDLTVLTHFEEREQVKFILSKEIRLSRKYLERNQIDVKILQSVTFVAPDKSYEIDDIKIKTIRSTDSGVAFLVELPDTMIYHGGDLNLWKWEGVGDLINGKEEREYKSAIRTIRDKKIDIAFVPLDPRLGTHALDGISFFMENIHADKVFPMHMWGDYKWIKSFKQQTTNSLFAERIVEIEYENQVFQLDTEIDCK
ncbi:MAG: MBL fold metallo-hydrolase [Lachnospiraceae bacterium]